MSQGRRYKDLSKKDQQAWLMYQDFWKLANPKRAIRNQKKAHENYRKNSPHKYKANRLRYFQKNRLAIRMLTQLEYLMIKDGKLKKGEGGRPKRG